LAKKSACKLLLFIFPVFDRASGGFPQCVLPRSREREAKLSGAGQYFACGDALARPT
jgi:hypothetical protein